jgi:hypothetical protein
MNNYCVKKEQFHKTHIFRTFWWQKKLDDKKLLATIEKYSLFSKCENLKKIK